MSTVANDAVNIPKASTGPRTEAGKSKSSRNAIRTGLESPLRGESLYAARDFIRAGEEEEYAQTLTSLNVRSLALKAPSKRPSPPRLLAPPGNSAVAASSKKPSALWKTWTSTP